MEILLWHKSTHTQHILTLLYSKFIEIFRIVAILRLRHTIIYKVYVLSSAILLCYKILDYIRDNDNIICKHTSHSFSQLQYSLSCKSPLISVIVRAMMRKHHLHAQQFCIRNKQSRTDGMDMQHICPQFLRLIDGSEGMDDRLETLLLWRRQSD